MLLHYIFLAYITFCKSSCSNPEPNHAKTTLTNTVQTDGFGSQFQNIISTAVYAELTHKNFIYTPFQKMEHNYLADKYFLEKKEKLINFIQYFEINLNANIETKIDCKNFFDQNISQCAKSTTLKKIKKIFREKKNYDNYFDKKYLNIAVHIRRPNQDDNRLMGANIANSYFLNVIDKLRLNYTNLNPHFHIYSQGSIENFAVFNSNDITLHVDESVEDTFASLVFADVLVTCASSFSYTAGLLSDGIVYYIPFWHEPLPHWIRLMKPDEI